jgi:hypothetical protein
MSIITAGRRVCFFGGMKIVNLLIEVTNKLSICRGQAEGNQYPGFCWLQGKDRQKLCGEYQEAYAQPVR